VAYKVTLEQVLVRVRQKANVENVTQFVTEAELTDMTNQSLAEWYDMIRLTTFGGQYYRSTYAITTVGTQGTYALPTDFLNLLSVDCFLTPGASTTSMVRSARPYQEEQRNMFRYWPVGGWLVSNPIFYQLQGPNISFIPTPQSAFQVNLNYTPTAPVLVSATDSFDSINGLDEWIVIDVAIKVLQKGNKSERIAQLSPYLMRQEARIKSTVGQRDQYGTETVHDVEQDYEGWFLG
jgi:hypothetical protein